MIALAEPENEPDNELVLTTLADDAPT